MVVLMLDISPNLFVMNHQLKLHAYFRVPYLMYKVKKRWVEWFCFVYVLFCAVQRAAFLAEYFV